VKLKGNHGKLPKQWNQNENLNSKICAKEMKLILHIIKGPESIPLALTFSISGFFT
jgi:hypothetical protein